jgi:hypothetical protein
MSSRLTIKEIRWPDYLMHRLALPGILIWALMIRLWDLRQPFIGDYAWNEVYYAYIARNFFRGSLLVQHDLFLGTPIYSFPLVPWLIYGSFRLFGLVEWAARLPFLVFGLAALIILFLLVRTLYGYRLALAATFLAATVPGIVFFSRNIQLDGIMTTFGLGALLAMVLLQRDGRRVWFGISLVLFTLAILTKYTAVLFWPALVWAWFDNGLMWRDRRRWLGLIAYTVVALATAMLWIVVLFFFMPRLEPSALAVQESILAEQSVSSGEAVRAYFIRFNEWNFDNFKNAFLSLWPNTSRHLGSAVWYPSILLGAFALAKTQSVKVLETLKKYALPILIIVPWYLQIGYPSSWLANEYYDYPALFAICILLAALGLAVFEHVVTWLNLHGHRLRIVIAFSVGLVLFSNAWDYKAFYHSSYYPWPIISQPASYYSARRVAALNIDHKPVLTDLPFTLYYTEADRSYGEYIWWFGSDDPTIEAIKNRKFEYIAFTYPPTINIIDAIYASGYEQIAPAAWRRLPDAAIVPGETSCSEGASR